MKSRRIPQMIALVALSAFLGKNVQGQDEKKTKKKEIPKPQRVVLKTLDQVNIVCNFFGGTKEKESVPVILLHDHGGNKEQFTAFALYLQKSYGWAVIVPDLRGHGESNKTVTNREIDFSKFRKSDFELFNEDISTCFRYLRDEVNNKGQANIDMLGVVATGYVGINALAWTLEDYAYPPLNGKKQGQFVKGLVLLSPRKSIKGFSVTQLLKNPLFSGKGINPMPLLVAIGKGDEKSYRDGKSIHTSLSRTRPSYDKIADPVQRYKKLSIWLGEYKKGFGASMLDPDNQTKLEIFIARFITYKILEQSNDFPWVNYEKKE